MAAQWDPLTKSCKIGISYIYTGSEVDVKKADRSGMQCMVRVQKKKLLEEQNMSGYYHLYLSDL